MCSGRKVTQACSYCGKPVCRFPSQAHPPVFCDRVCLGHWTSITCAPQRFWARVKKDSDNACWLWQGRLYSNGYGRLCFQGRKDRLAHRVAWELTYGPIPEGIEVCHTCDTPACVWAAGHLFLGTHQDNMDDMVRKGRRQWVRKHPARATGCPYQQVTSGQVKDIRAIGETLSWDERHRLAEQIGITFRHFSDILHENCWKFPDQSRQYLRGNQNPGARLTEAQARYALSMKGRRSQRSLAEELGVSPITIARIHHGDSWIDLVALEELGDETHG